MTRLRLILILAAIAVANSASASERRFELLPTAGQRVEYVDGKQMMLVEGSTSTIVIAFVPESRKCGWIALAVRNTSSDAFVVQETSLRALERDQPLQVFTYSMLEKKQHQKEAWRQFGAALGAAGNSMSAANAGNSYTTGSYSGTTRATAYGSGGYATATGYTSGTYSSVTYDPAKAAAARAQADAKNSELLNEVQQTNSIERESLESRALRANTVSPGEAVSGQVKIRLPRSSDLNLQLSVGNDVFNIALKEIEE